MKTENKDTNIKTNNQSDMIDSPQYEKATKKKYMVRSAICLAAGGIAGFLFAFGSTHLKTFLTAFTKYTHIYFPVVQIYLLPWFLLVFTLICTIINEKLLKKSKSQIASWDGENDDHINIADTCLNKVLLVASIESVGIQMIFAVITYHLMQNLQNKSDTNALMIFIAVAIYCASLAAIILQQKHVIQLVKKYSPEKRGSIYDKHFQDIWFATCDEGERHIIYNACYKTHQFMNKTFSVCLAAATVIGMFVSIGILCAIIIGFLWLIMTCCYIRECIRLENGR